MHDGARRRAGATDAVREPNGLQQKPRDADALALTIDLGALAANWRHLASIAAPAECAAVVKADAYGIGIEPAVAALAAAGCHTFFVALPEEGRRVRAALLDTDNRDAVIYVLDGFLPDWADVLRTARLSPVLNTFASIEAWAEHCPGAPSAIQVDTGMNRLGLSLHEALELFRRPELRQKLAPHLVMTHLACADDPEHPLNVSQLALFRELRAELPNIPASLANSAGIHLGPDYLFDLVRPGIALYGAEFAKDRPPLPTVVTAKARILQVREAAAGETDRLRRDQAPCGGYAHRHPRGGLCGWLYRLAGSSDERPGAFVSVRGRRAPLLGRVSMDLIAVDVTGIVGVTEGGWVELFGATFPIDEVARAAGTIGYELLTGLCRRAERSYLHRPRSA